MRGESPAEQLDRYIDALQRGEEPAIDAVADPDLASLCALAREVRRLGEAELPDADYPARAVSWLAQELRRPAPSAGAAIDDHVVPLLLNGHREQRAALPPDIASTRRERRWARQWLEMVAAVLVVALVATVVGAILRQRAGVEEQTGPGAQPMITGFQPMATATPTPASTPTTVAVTATPELSALQAAAGFDLVAPAWLPEGIELEQTLPPMRLPGFTSVQFTYRDADGKRVLTITQASPYEETRETMPAEIYDAAVEVDLGDGTIARVHEGDQMNQIWWQRGPTTVRLESGPVEDGGRVLTTDELLTIARSMAPVPVLEPPASPSPDAALSTSDAAIARAREVVRDLGGNESAEAADVRLTSLAEPVALGMSAPDGLEQNAPVWHVELTNALMPPECPEAGSSICGNGTIVIVLDAESGELLGWHGHVGAWMPPAAEPTE
ncbi:hypothetical protein [Sphaerobacter sp.]|uniref:hypothetical protein n=1 Tax=Sphaerobacter sp. TaxID=2099654 RepID=UPI001D502793|nr:hypothetical protein [Sphaerobacter sp.]MBX5445856.1 hypothetical protein [Sphaerobacter sp.]